MSSAEMHIFVKNFSLIVGDLIDKEDSVWEMFLLLHDICEIVSLRTVNIHYANLIKHLIANHHILYMNHCGDLKPKHHFLTHYADMMLKFGPLYQISSIRFEAKHKNFKSNAHVVKTRINISYTLALKNQLAQCERLILKKGFERRISYGNSRYVLLKELFFNFTIQDNYSIPLTNNVHLYTWVEINGIKYKPGLAVFIKYTHFFLVFGKLRYIVTDEGSNIYFICTLMNTVLYNDHLRAYEIKCTNIEHLVKYENLTDISTLFLNYCSEGKMYIKI